MIFVGLDDTDVLESRGTGHLAREIATTLADEGYRLLGVTRHQLLVDPRVPCTKNNSSAAILLEAPGGADLDALLARVRDMMVAAGVPGSDPGLCVAADVLPEVTVFGHRAQRELVTRAEAYDLARDVGLPLLGLGGDESGVIGALSAVGLAASGEDGRYVLVGTMRELFGLQPVSAVLDAGIAAVRTLDGEAVTEGLVQTDRLRPARRGGLPIAVVERADGYWMPLKLD